MSTICPTCGHIFYDYKHKHKIFCSQLCYFEDKIAVVNCKGCNIPFVKRRAAHTLYCSAKCGFKHRQKRNDPTKSKTKNCEECNKPFKSWTYRNTRYCSIRCARNADRKPDNFTNMYCETCGNEYKIHKGVLKTRKSRFCSRVCYAEGMSRERQGENNVNYRGGTVRYRGRNWSKQKRAAMKRDNYKCQICGVNVKSLRKWGYAVHHIKPYREFDGDYKAANQLSNLITLCRHCHGKVEHGGYLCPHPNH